MGLPGLGAFIIGVVFCWVKGGWLHSILYHIKEPKIVLVFISAPVFADKGLKVGPGRSMGPV